MSKRLIAQLVILFACTGEGSRVTADGDFDAIEEATLEIVQELAVFEATDTLEATSSDNDGDASALDFSPSEVEAVSEVDTPYEIADGPWAALCKTPCESDADCGSAKARCLTFQQTGVRFCALPCEVQPCPDGFFCASVKGEALCVPLTSDCTNATMAVWCDQNDLGGICKGDFPTCTSSDPRRGYCTKGCASDLDCPVGLPRCRLGLCRALWEEGPEGCGLAPAKTPAGPGAGCHDASECGPEAPLCVQVKGAPGLVCSGVGEGGPKPAGACSCLLLQDALYGKALAQVGLTPCTAIFPKYWTLVWPSYLGFDPWRLTRFHQLHDYPGATLQGVRTEIGSLDEGFELALVPLAIERGAALLDRPISPVGPIQPSPTLADAITAFIAASAGTPDKAAIIAALAPVQPQVTEPLIPILDAMTEFVKVRKKLVDAIGSAAAQMFFTGAHGFALPGATPLPAGAPWVKDALSGKTFDYAALYTAAYRVAKAVAEAKWPAFVAFEGTVRIETPAGVIAIGGTSNDAYASPAWNTPVALLVDLGGDDTYLIPAGANESLSNPISLVIDLSGNDTYAYEPAGPAPDPMLLPPDAGGRYVPSAGPDQDYGPISLSSTGRQGCGRLGVGMLFDLGAGTDRYESLRMSQGAAVLGVGVLYDGGGDDVYRAEAMSQGAAMFGIGVLVDASGNDHYEGFHEVQGFAYVRAFGLLYDAGGSDDYVARPGDPSLGGLPLYYNPQNPGKSNSSMAQGFGFGRRADYDHVYMSGGFGVLRDRSGNDTYLADVFAQGGGYWFGTGILADGSGDDTYDGRWYVQGAAAHFALGVLMDDLGNDKYNPTLPGLNATLGLGHDFSLGVFHDAAGNDEYHSPSLSIGAGNDNGIGIFLDSAGDDKYSASAVNTFGWASNSDFGPGNIRNEFQCTGVFLDTGGKDSYFRPDFAGVGIADNATWTMAPADPAMRPNEHGVGIDGEGLSGL